MAQGYDLEQLQVLCERHRPKVFFTQPRLQNPTGSCTPLGQLHQLLQMASQQQMTLVENDIYADLDANNRPSLASLDQLNRVIHISSFSKTIAPHLRVGYVLAHADAIRQLSILKMMSGLTSSELNERLAWHILTEGRWHKHLRVLQDRLAEAHYQTVRWLTGQGFEVFAQPQTGLFLWAKHPEVKDSQLWAEAASRHRIMLGPGHMFRTNNDSSPSPWLRFNVAFSLDSALHSHVQRHLNNPSA